LAGIALRNDQGESIWTQPFTFNNTATSDQLIGTFGTPTGGPMMPNWFMAVIDTGTTPAGFHWPSSQAINVYVASVSHGDAAPSEYRLYGTASADGPIVINSVPGSGTQFTARTVPTAQISTEAFMGEGGQRYAALLRQDTMGNLSPIDPRGIIGVQFAGAINDSVVIGVQGGGNLMLISVDDVTLYAPGQNVTVTSAAVPAWNRTFPIVGIQLSDTLVYPGTNQGYNPTGFPSGTLLCTCSGLTTNSGATAAGNVSIAAGPCPVALEATKSFQLLTCRRVGERIDSGEFMDLKADETLLPGGMAQPA
jgi:hypothetical protein